MIAIAHGGGFGIDVGRVVITLMVRTRAGLGDGDGGGGFGVGDEFRNKALLLLGVHRVAENVRHFPALIHDYGETEIAHGELFADDA